MKRREFLDIALLAGAGIASLNQIKALNQLNNLVNPTANMPVLFLGHGNPMNAISDNKYTRNWGKIAKDIPKPSAILCISAHWETIGTKVTAMENPRMIYDMYGFPKELYEVKYSCPGSTEKADLISKEIDYSPVMKDMDWGLDHGAWSLLVKMYPEANIPCFQLSLNKTRDMKWHYEMGKQLAFLRRRGVLIIGSGNIVHNLQYARFDKTEPYDWALEFDHAVRDAIENKNHDDLIHYERFGKSGMLSVNSAEHYIPMLYALSLQEKNENITQFNEDIDFGSGGMRCFKVG